MAKTLADMTAEERIKCAGMWAQTPGGALAIIADAGTTRLSWLVLPCTAGDRSVYGNGYVTPRFDLPRAWAPDGGPVGVVVDSKVEPLRVNGIVNPYG